ncbi:hypothetical protein RKD29_003549 [Streptomyces tendae]|uniref:hypothetical protein n=1 Tax=Streptomyces tendae TaxID=1932 RepID=UPI003835AAEA
MPDLIHRIAHWLTLLLGPGTGTHRDRQRHRRLALVLAADFGIDLDQHVVGARKAAA